MSAAVAIITDKDVRAHIDETSCRRLMKEAMNDLGTGVAVNHPRDILFLPKGIGALGSMSAFSESYNVASAKLAGVFPQNSHTALDVHQGAILLFDTQLGRLKAIVDASAITALRTAGLSALATEYLAPESARNLVVFGAGIQAYHHIQAMREIRPIEKVTLVNRSRSRALQLIERLQKETFSAGLDFRVLGEEREVLQEADIICMTTASASPLLTSEFLPKRVHINAVGACTPLQRELSGDVIGEAQVYVDSKAAAVKEAGDLVMAREENYYFSIKELSGIGQGSIPKLEGPSLFKSVGLGVQDLYVADYVYRSMKNAENFSSIELGGLR